MFELLGESPAIAANDAQAVMRIDTAMANGSQTQVERRDPKLLYHKMTRKEVDALTPSFRWKAYFSGTGQSGVRELNVIAPEFFKTMHAVLQKEDLDSWKAYLRWHLVHANAAYMSSASWTLTLIFRQGSFGCEGTRAVLETMRELRGQRPARRWARLTQRAFRGIKQRAGNGARDRAGHQRTSTDSGCRWNEAEGAGPWPTRSAILTSGATTAH
jgi:hypothetical protein